MLIVASIVMLIVASMASTEVWFVSRGHRRAGYVLRVATVRYVSFWRGSYCRRRR